MPHRKIVVTGSCQASGLASALSLFLPESEVSAHVLVGTESDEAKSTIVAALRSADLWVSATPRSFGALPEVEALSGIRFFQYPALIFRAFHPDNSAAIGKGGQPLCGAHGTPYCSVLAFWAWREGLTVDQTGRLFCEEVFRHIGYLGLWQASVEHLRVLFVAGGLDFEAFMLQMKRSGNFMHTHNHPKFIALAELARQILVALGISHHEHEEPQAFVSDALESIVWPVYPPVARFYGIPGSYVWRNDRRLVQGLADFIELSFEAYAGHDPADYSVAHLTPALEQAFRTAAGR